MIVCVLLVAIDRIVLKPSSDEQYWLKPYAGWLRQNATIKEEIVKAATTDAFPGQPKMRIAPAGVVSWAGHPVSLEKPPGMKRILVKGDSFVSGAPYLTHNHMWWRQLGQMLQEHAVEVIVVGRAGASTRDQLRWARYFVPRYKPDLIIWGYVTNDPDEGRIPPIKAEEVIVPVDSPFYPGWQLVRKALARIAATLGTRRRQKLCVKWEMSLVEAANLAGYGQMLSEPKTFMDESKIPGFMVTLPVWPSLSFYDPFYTPLLKAWKDAGLAVHHTLPAFVKQYGEQAFWGSGAATVSCSMSTRRIFRRQVSLLSNREWPMR